MSGASEAVRADTYAAKYAAKIHAVLDGEYDPFSLVWIEMGPEEQGFWLQFSRLSRNYAGWNWLSIPGDKRSILKNNLYRGALRLQVLAKALQ